MIVHIDRHSDLNVPPASFAETPLSSYSRESGERWLAAAHRAATEEADLANFQLTGVWTGVIDSVIWLHGNGSEIFRVSDDGAKERFCAGLACPLQQRLQLQPDRTFAIVNRAMPATTSNTGRGRDSGFAPVSAFGFLHPPAEGALSSLGPSAEFDLWLGHVDHPLTTAASVASLLHGRPWVLDIDLDVFMPVGFTHRCAELHVPRAGPVRCCGV